MKHDQWTITPQLAGQLRDLLRPNMRTLECGSGLSTAIFRATGTDHHALEHLEKFAAAHGVPHTPLDKKAKWYKTTPALSPEKPYELILVDGPPKDHGHRTGILHHLPAIADRRTIWIVDDTQRPLDRKLAQELRRRYQLEEATFHAGARRWTILRPPVGIESWAVGVLAAKRPAKPTLPATLASLRAAGFGSPVVFAEPGVEVPAGVESVRRPARLGAWHNWIDALARLAATKPDAVLLCQDDVAFCGDLRPYLEATLWPARPHRVALCSPYCPGPLRQPFRGWNQVRLGSALTGALCWAIPPAAADLIVDALAGRFRTSPGEARIDLKIGRWAGNKGLLIYYHTPSLAQHTGNRNSALGDQLAGDLRRAGDFPGREYRPEPFRMYPKPKP